MCSASLPPLVNQPQWPRVLRLDSVLHSSSSPPQRALLPPWDQVLPASEGDINKKMGILEKRFQFLQQQHTDTLGKLHQEIEQLRRENRDLQYQLIMSEKLSDKGSSTVPVLHESKKKRSTSTSADVKDSQDDRQFAQSKNSASLQISPPEKQKERQEEMVNEQGDTKVQQSLAPTTSVKMEWKTLPVQPSCGDCKMEEQALSSAQTQSTETRLGHSRLPVISLNPLLVNGPTGQPPRAPNLLECENIIHQLWNTNHTQAQELQRLKNFLGEVVSKNKWTPESYLVAKGLLSQPPREKDVIHFPKVAVKGDPKTWIKAPLTGSDRVILPALKQTLGNSLVERQKRSQAVQRNRMRRPVL
ncbi:coiled-coil domain-containing protein 74B [Pleurodeles waltl]